MEEGRQKSKRLSNTAKFKREVIRCTEDKRNAKPLQFLELMKTPFDWRKHKAAIGACEASRKKFTGPKIPEIDYAIFKFFRERRKTGLFVSYDLLRKEAIKKGQIFLTILEVMLKPVKDGL